MKKRYTFPDGHPIKEIVLRELTVKDELEAAVWAEAKRVGALQDQQQVFLRELMRIAICEVDGKVVSPAAPYSGMDNWPLRTMRVYQECFADLNGFEEEDAKNVVAGAEVVSEAPKELDTATLNVASGRSTSKSAGI